MMRQKEKTADQEKGAVIIEAAIVLPFFMFMMIILYSIVQIAYVQSRVSVALDCAAKELAQYAHVYYATGMNSSFTGGEGESSQIANEVGEFLSTVGENVSTLDSELGQFVGGAGEALKGDSLSSALKNSAGDGMVMHMMKKNLVNGSDDSSEAFLKRNHVEGLNMMGSRILDKAGEIFLCVNYDVKVIKLLGLDFSFHFSSCAYTQAWGAE